MFTNCISRHRCHHQFTYVIYVIYDFITAAEQFIDNRQELLFLATCIVIIRNSHNLAMHICTLCGSVIDKAYILSSK